MPTIRPFDDIPSLAPPPAKAQTESELGQADFLKLMITQFQNQDPFKPMENGEFLGQIAQFSTVSGIDDLNSGFQTLATSIQDEQALKAASLVGRSVIAESNIGYLGADRPLNGSVEIDGYVSAVQIDIKDGSGDVIQRLNLGEQQDGIVEFAWDGQDALGRPRAPGNYELEARIVRGSQVENIETFVEASVQSVTLGRQGEGMTLNLLGGGELSLGRIYRIN
jgi:flagellar basal-body rod modification protein FlgD